MNRKIKKYAEKQLVQYRNEEYLKELKGHQREKMRQQSFFNKKMVALSVTLGVLIVTLTVSLLCVFLIKPTATDTNVEKQTPLQIDPTQEEPTQEPPTQEAPIQEVIPSKKYLEENIRMEECDLNEVNNLLNYFSFLEGEHIKKYTDKEYNETLYYEIGYKSEDELLTLEFTICVNSDYKMDEFIKDYDKEGTVAAQEIQYSETAECEDDIYFFKEIGKILTDKEMILIKADIIGLEEDSNFIEILNEIIQEK